MPVRLCLEPRCGNPAAYRGRCTEHVRTTNRVTHARKHFYNSKRWQILRRRVLFEQPICAICDETLAVDVDHIVAIEAGGDPWARANCQGICVSCHSSKTMKELAAR